MNLNQQQDIHNKNESERIANIYQKIAKNYDFLGEYLLGMIFSPFGYGSYRQKAIASLNLQPGDTVIDLCCGTGLNFPLLEKAIGSEGKIIGVDLTDAMLAQAQKRVEKNGWSNVELMQSDVTFYQFPIGVDGIISTWGITLVSECDLAIQNGSQALSPGERWVILDFKIPDNWLARFAPLLSFLFIRPFGGNLQMASRHPWESLDKYLQNISFTELLLGFAYIAVGQRKEEKVYYE
ncbi:class I SAM-dependent methyltransferase [Myxosarcina sp. GI1]|uniref:class I SAM-dependent methyltransferase n=1 Tax=Myxosarcina sp. GI1 TaxID=1541065 RepID=UPI000567CB95|nr:class I SAM-dependent methyltransferase [Myxosarcina sp. GI1]